MTVYVVQKPQPGGPNRTTFDLSPALTFGSIVYIFDAQDCPGLTPGPSLLKAQKVLKDFSDQDFLCWAGGDPTAMIIATMAAARMNRGRVGFLKWERHRNELGGRSALGYYVPQYVSTRIEDEH